MGAVDSTAATQFLTAAAEGPSALVIEGEAGIGKTTLWLAVVQQAHERGFRVLSAQPAQAESVQAYASLADLLGGIEPAVWAGLPEPQRLAIDQVLLRTESHNQATDQRAVAAAFLSVITSLTDQTPVLVAIDDLQWLDPSTVQVMAFAARRLVGPVGVLVAERTEPTSETTASWVRLPRPDAVRRIQVPPLTLGGLHSVLSERLGRTFSRPTMMRIQEISGGNPFYAIELARAMGDGAAGADSPLPGSLAELVQDRVGWLEAEVQDVLLAAACATAPTVDLVARATGCDTDDIVGVLEKAEANGIIEIAGHHLRFTHPLLAQGVYANANPAHRRAMHRRLADVVTQPELRARHLALGTITSDPVTLQSLDGAAEIARRRGAPAAAAELLDLAIGLGGDTSERRLLLARHHLDAGDLGRARVLLEKTIEASAPGILRAEALSLLALVRQLDDSFVDAVALLARALADVGDHLTLRVEILVAVSYASMLVGDLPGALRYATEALVAAEQLGQSQLLGQALGVRVMLGALHGEGVDEARMQRALEQEDTGYVTMFLRPRFNNVLTQAWLGRVEDARTELETVRQQCLERGDETALIVAAFNYVVGAVWLGAFAEATLIAEDSMERALLAGGDQSLMLAQSSQALLAAYAGRVEEARRIGDEVTAAGYRGGALFLLGWNLTSMGFLELSLGNHAATLSVLEPLIYLFHESPQATEIGTAGFIPDAAEAFVALGRLDEAEPLVAALESNGARLDRAWMLAVGGRCRALVLAAQGDLNAATDAAQQALAEHDRLPMPFERARTQLLLGQLLRRRKQKDAASATMREALATFEALGTPLWAEKARAALARSNVGPRTTPGLTPSELRVAELAASGMTNRDVAAALFISPKTVEANLSRIYHKLGIRSRAELGRHMGQPDTSNS